MRRHQNLGHSAASLTPRVLAKGSSGVVGEGRERYIYGEIHFTRTHLNSVKRAADLKGFSLPSDVFLGWG